MTAKLTVLPPLNAGQRFMRRKYGDAVPTEEMLIDVWRWLNPMNRALLTGAITHYVKEQLDRS